MLKEALSTEELDRVAEEAFQARKLRFETDEDSAFIPPERRESIAELCAAAARDEHKAQHADSEGYRKDKERQVSIYRREALALTKGITYSYMNEPLPDAQRSLMIAMNRLEDVLQEAGAMPWRDYDAKFLMAQAIAWTTRSGLEDLLQGFVRDFFSGPLHVIIEQDQ